MNNKIIVSRVVPFVVAVVIIGGVTFFNKDIYQGQQVLDDSSGAMLVGDNAINMNKQRIGNSVVASFVVLESNGFVVLHEIANGNPGKIIGSSTLLPEGQSSNVTISVSSPLKEGNNYVAILHLDNGDGVFHVASDAQAKNGTDVVMMEFQADTTADGRDVISI